MHLLCFENINGEEYDLKIAMLIELVIRSILTSQQWK